MMRPSGGPTCPACGAPGVTEHGRFRPLPPLRIARRHADAELAGKATPAQVAWLYEHPVMWLRALTEIIKDIECRIAKARTDLAALRPMPGEQPSAEYMTAKAEVEARSCARLHIARLADSRRAEVASLLGPDPIANVTTGDLVQLMHLILDLVADDDIASIEQVARHHLKKLSRMAVPA